jgi:uncharacterized protein (TIGR02996 family)
MGAELTDLWRAVIAERDDLTPRLVLADALLERGDVRGELIHLQCDGNKTLRATDSDEPFAVYTDTAARTVDFAERAAGLIRDHWVDWLGPLGKLVRREWSWFHEGMLFGIRPTGTVEAWRDLPDLPELAMVRKVRWNTRQDQFWDRDTDFTGPNVYAAAIARLPNTPTWIDLDTQSQADALARYQTTWPIPGLRLLHVDPARLGALFPEVESLIVKTEPGDPVAPLTVPERREVIERLERARQAFPRLRTIAFADRWLQIRLTPGDRDFASRLRGLGAVDV